jgi:hypothetical protein
VKGSRRSVVEIKRFSTPTVEIRRLQARVAIPNALNDMKFN